MSTSRTLAERPELCRTPRTRKEAGHAWEDLTEDRGAGLISGLVLLVCALVTAAVLWGACALLFSVDTDTESERKAELVRMHAEVRP